MTNTEGTTTMPRPSWQTALTGGIIISNMLLGWINGAAAQSRPIADDTLGNERSTVVGGTSGDRIDGGARRGDNLFHSFQEFGVDIGRSVYFSDPGVNNIITRVTGGNSSQIDGILGVLGNANLFLINPSGIIFGTNAQLDVGGSFTATTADAIKFNNQGNFSATNPTTPPLLTVQPSAFLINQLNPAPIANNSVASTQANPSGYTGFGLRVSNGKGLTLLGGNISMDGGGVNALGGRVEIGGLGAPGTVSRNPDGNLSFPPAVARANVSLTNQGSIDVAADGGGSISIHADNFEIYSSRLVAGIGIDSGSVGAQAGDIMLNANTIRAGDSTIIENLVNVGGTSNAGDIRITTGSLFLTEDAQLSTSTFGQGDAGNVVIKAQEHVSLDNSLIFSNVDNVGDVDSDEIAKGDGGDINITTGSLSLTNDAQLQASTLGQGDAGNVVIKAQERVSLDNSLIVSNVGDVDSDEIAKGDGGDISITTGSLSLTNDAQLQASTLGQGDAGNVVIKAQEHVSLDNSLIFSNVGDVDSDEIAVGNGGDISITTGSLSLTNGAGLQPGSSGQGNAGNVIINAQERVSLDNASFIFTSVTPDAKGKGGDISITAGSLSLTNGAALQASTIGQGNAGNVIINAQERVSLDRASFIFSSVGITNSDEIAVGNGGDISITTDLLSLTNGAQLSANTLGQGDAGNVVIKAQERVSLDNSLIFSSVGITNSGAIAVGKGGDISIFAGSLFLTNGAQLQASTLGQGDAGNVIIKVRDRVSLAGVNQGKPSSIFTFTDIVAQGRGGDISITADSVRIADSAIVTASTENSFPAGSVNFDSNTFEATGGGQVNTTTYGSGQAGNIILNARDRITLWGVSPNILVPELDTASGLYAGTYRNSSGTGGTIQIATGKLHIFDGATVAVNSQGSRVAGDIDITAAQVQLNNSSRLTAETAAVDGGNITLNDVKLLQLRGGSLISTTAGTDGAGGNGGNIDIDADIIAAFTNENSDIRANAFTGSGGNVRIATQGLFGIAFQAQDNPITNDITASSQQGLQGTVNITPLEVDPRNGLTQLPVEVVDASDRIAQGCHGAQARQNTSEFIVKGRGGLLPSPTDLLIGDESLASWVSVDNTDGQQTSTALPTPKTATTAPIVEAQAWIVDSDGKVNLVATAPNNAAQVPLICQHQENK